MAWTIKGRHLELTEALENHAREHLLEPLRELVGDRGHATVELAEEGHHKDGENFTCKVHVVLEHLPAVHLHHRDSNMYRAMDAARDRVMALTKKALGKERRYRHRPDVARF